MGLIKVITDRDLGLEEVMMDDPQTRYGARGIVFDKNKNIALFYNSIKNSYKLPGGGMQAEENPEDVFINAVLEEINCEIEVICQMGKIEEWKTRENFKQESFVYIGKIIKKCPKLLDQNKAYKVIWVPLKQAIKLLSNCLDNLSESQTDSVYRTKFMVIRDLEILNYYKRNKDLIKLGDEMRSFVLCKKEKYYAKNL